MPPTLGDRVSGGFPGRQWQDFERDIDNVQRDDIFYDGPFAGGVSGESYRELYRRLYKAYHYLWQHDSLHGTMT